MVLSGDSAVWEIYSLCASTFTIKEDIPNIQTSLPTLSSEELDFFWNMRASVLTQTNPVLKERLCSRRRPPPPPRLCLVAETQLCLETWQAFLSRAGSYCWVCLGVGSVLTTSPSTTVCQCQLCLDGLETTRSRRQTSSFTALVLIDIITQPRMGVWARVRGCVYRNSTWAFTLWGK